MNKYSSTEWNTLGVNDVGDVTSVTATVDVLGIDAEFVVVSATERRHVHRAEASVSDADPTAHGQFALLDDVVGNGAASVPRGRLPCQRQRVAADVVGVG